MPGFDEKLQAQCAVESLGDLFRSAVDRRTRLVVAAGRQVVRGFPGIARSAATRADAPIATVYDTDADVLHLFPLSSITAISVEAPEGAFSLLSGGRFSPPELAEAPTRLAVERRARDLTVEVGRVQSCRLTLDFDLDHPGARLNFTSVAAAISTVFATQSPAADFVAAWKGIHTVSFASGEANSRLTFEKKATTLRITFPVEYTVDSQTTKVRDMLLQTL
jgi:hypothetical protein